MTKCLECKNYCRNGKVHKCKAHPGTVYFSDSYPLEPIVDSCGAFERMPFKTSQMSKWRKK